MKKISVIIPCYNVENYLQRCFDSLKNQTIGIDQMELIFVDDCSKDNTLDILKSFEQQYPEDIILIPFSENVGQGAARNVALEYASAAYIGYVDSDDAIEYNMFEKMLSVIEETDCDFVQCRWDRIDENGSLSMTKPFDYPGYYNMSDADERKRFLSKNLRVISACDKLYKRDFLLENHILFPSGFIREDIAFCYQVYMKSKSMYCMNDVLYHYYINPKGTMKTSKQEYEKDVLSVCLFFWDACGDKLSCTDRKEDMEWLFLEMGYVYILWELCNDDSQRAFTYYQLVKGIIQQLNISYQRNSYRELEGNEFDNLMLKLLDMSLSQEQFLEVINHMKEKINMVDIED